MVTTAECLIAGPHDGETMVCIILEGQTVMLPYDLAQRMSRALVRSVEYCRKRRVELRGE